MTWLTDFIEQGGTTLKNRDGMTATSVTYINNPDGAFCVVAVVDGHIRTYTDEGRFIVSCRGDSEDLMPPIKRYWHCYDVKECHGHYSTGTISKWKQEHFAYQDEVQIIPVPKEGE